METQETTEHVEQAVGPSAEPGVVTPPEPNEGSRMKMVRQAFLGLGAVVLLVLGGVTALLYSPDSEAAPSMSWTPASLSVEVGAGQSTTTTATFVPSANASNVSVWVVPELAPYVSVSPTSFASVQKGINYQVTVNVAASSTAPLGVYDGTIHLRQGKKTLARPLPVRVEVVWPTFDGGEELGFSIQYPPGWYEKAGNDYAVFRNVVEPEPYSEWKLQTESYFEIYRQRAANTALTPIDEWVAEYSPRLPTPVQSTEYMNVGGRDAVRVMLSEMGGDRVHIYVADGADVLDINYGLFAPAFIPDYEAMVQTISFAE